MFINSSRVRTPSLSTLLLAGLISLHGCGGSRDEPFNPGDPDVDEEVLGATVTAEVKYSGTTPLRLSIDRGNKRLEVFRTEEDFFAALSDYMDVSNVPQPDFEKVQVLLYDAGSVNGNPCVHKLTFDKPSARQRNDDVVKVTLQFKESLASTATDCDDDIENISRPFRFIYIESRDTLIISEEIPNRSSSSTSSQSSSQSFAQSSSQSSTQSSSQSSAQSSSTF